MTRPLQLWLLADGKTGHLNQSLGLAEAIARITPAASHRIDLPPSRSFIRRIRHLAQSTQALPPPDIAIGAGHRTHAPLLVLKRHRHVPAVVIMKPSLPTRWFDLCLIPRHDLGRAAPPAHVIPTTGALNRVVAGPPDQTTGHLILVGGPSAQHGWDAAALTAAIREIAAPPQLWEVADSRRTPDGFLAALAGELPGIVVHPHAGTAPGWLAARLATAAEAWVTEDSVSMVYEALTAGARVGVLPMPRLRPAARVVRGLEQLAAGGCVTRFADWRDTHALHPPPTRLAEADRCAGIVLERLFPGRILGVRR